MFRYPRLRRLFRWFAGAFAVLVVLVALLISVFRVVVPQVPAYRGEVVSWASGVLGAPVSIQSLDLQWRRLRPEVVLTGVSFVSADASSAVAAREVRVAISLRTLLQQGRFAPAAITLVEPDVILVMEAQDASASGEEWQRAFSTGEHRGELIISRGRVTILADAGRRRVEVVGLDLRVFSDGNRHELRGTGRLHDEIGGLVRLRGRARGWPGEHDFAATANAEARGLDLVGLQRLGRTGRLDAGRMDIAISLSVDEGEAQHLTVDIGLTAMSWPAREGYGAGRVDRAVGEFVWTARDDGWDASLRRLEVGRQLATRTSGPLTVSFTAPTPSDSSAHWDLNAGRVEIDDLVLLGEALPWDFGGDLQSLLVRSPRGSLEQASMQIRRAPGQETRYALNLSASNLGLNGEHDVKIPGFTAVNVTVDADQDGGSMNLDMNNGTVELPWMFRDRFEVEQSAARAAWVRGQGAWDLRVTELSVRNSDIRVNGNAELRFGADTPLEMRIDAAFEDVNLARKSRYLPVFIMSDNLAAWLDRAVRAGHVTAGTFRLAGIFGGAEDSNENREMDIRFEAEGIELDYADDWPVLLNTAISGRFTFDGFWADVHGGDYAGTPVLGAQVSIAGFEQGLLSVDARTGNDLKVMFDGLRQTPIGQADWLADATASGDAELQLKLGIDLAGSVPPEVEGLVVIRDARFGVGGFAFPLERLRGNVAIAGDGFSADGVRGELLRGPVAVSARTLRDSDGTARAVEVSLDGSLNRDTLELLTGYQGLPVSGTAVWQARMLAPYGTEQAPILQVESDLFGLAINLPEPVGKPADRVQGLELQLELAGERRRLVVNSAGRLRADASLVREHDRWRIGQGRAHLGGGNPGPMPDRDFAVTGRLAEWTLRPQGLTDSAANDPFELARIDLVIEQLNAWGHALGEVALQGSRSELGWYWLLDGDRVSGSIDIPFLPTEERPVRADIARLDMPVAVREHADAPAHANPATLPPIAFHAGDLRIGVMHLGEVNGFVRPVENGVLLDGFTATRADMRLSADASWYTVGGQHRTVLSGVVDSTNVLQTLSGLGYAASVDAAAGHLQVDVSWMDSPLANLLPTLNGDLQVRMDRGTLHDLQPGAGRIFGLLSLNALPRRLALDFSDVYRRGLAFDTIRGSFEIRDGHAFTDDLVLQGPAARVEITGRTGLAVRDYDQEATVVGSLASSLTLAGTLVGGPAVGAALLIASELFRGPLEDMARAHYRLTGPWEQPVVERIPEPSRESR